MDLIDKIVEAYKEEVKREGGTVNKSKLDRFRTKILNIFEEEDRL